MNEQDQKIRKLWETAQTKKNEIAKIEKKASWETNCSFKYGDGLSDSFNIQTVSDPAVFVAALAFLNNKEESFEAAAKELGVTVSKFKWAGYSVEDWKTDFLSRIAKVTLSTKKKELDTLQKRLDSLISPELRRTLELEEIEKELS
jgi:hypothetical protein